MPSLKWRKEGWEGESRTVGKEAGEETERRKRRKERREQTT